jgi:hypothetical protein
MTLMKIPYYIAILGGDYLVYAPWKDPKAVGLPFTPPLVPAARLPNLPGSRVHVGLLLGLLSAGLALPPPRARPTQERNEPETWAGETFSLLKAS